MDIRLANKDEIITLTKVSKSAFDTDIEVGNSEFGGPPYYDSQKWHASMLKGSHLFSILESSEIIGGAILFRDNAEKNIMYVGRIFISPKYHRKGYGSKAMLELEKMFLDINTWRLETPLWNIRTNQFYPKLGYIEMTRDEESVYYQKEICHGGM